uniref:Transmembrane protein 120 homolog n=1 Tax=Onchocerca volvulus TaxID=6282 RepID=A0A8R1U017_ONCVO
MIDDKNSFERIFDEWRSLKNEFDDIEDRHRIYLGKLQEVTKLQEECQKAVKHCLYRLSKVNESLRRLKGKEQLGNAENLTKMKEGIAELERKAQDMKGELPVQNNGLYLSIILGSNLNVSLMNKNDRYRYKQEYEKFKVTVNCALLFLLFLALIFTSRILDFIINFALVWFYCTLTIREAVLRINGSRIKGWWIMHHYVSCVLSGMTVTWGDGECYRSIRTHFIIFCFYLSFVQLLQCRYQTGCLRRLHALGQRYSMDISVEGFSSWMFKGLTFLIPFLVSNYIFQFYTSYKLYHLSKESICINQWQVPILSYGFFIVACCNMSTLLSVIINKWTEGQQTSTLAALRSKYRSNSPVEKD